MRFSAMAVLFAFSALALSGCLGNEDSSPDSTPNTGSTADPTPTAVVGLQDNGINAYHMQFRDPSPLAQQHPSTYLPDYPEDAVALHLSFNTTEFWEAVHFDCERVWSNITAGQLYWFPGTKIVGAITFQDAPAPDCDADEPFVGGILASSHGTMTASRAAGFEYGACKVCRIVMVEGFDRPGVEWLGDNAAWIDVQSHSWGPIAPGWSGPVDTGLLVSDSALVTAIEESAQQNLAFWAAGNGAAFRFGVVGHPTQGAPHFTPSVNIVGGHDSGNVNLWPGWTPHIIADSCNSWAAHHTNMTTSAENVGGGTSGATPWVAGSAARVLAEARTLLGDTRTGVQDGVVARGDPGSITEGPLSDGEFTFTEWRDVVLKTATPRPEGQYEDGSLCDDPLNAPYNTYPVAWQDIPEAAPLFAYIGYGAVDNASMQTSLAVLAGVVPLPDRMAEDQYFTADRQYREATYQAWTTGS